MKMITNKNNNDKKTKIVVYIIKKAFYNYIKLF